MGFTPRSLSEKIAAFCFNLPRPLFVKEGGNISIFMMNNDMVDVVIHQDDF